MKKRQLPDWLKVRLPNNEIYKEVKTIIKKNSLNTVCSFAKCPNQGECFSSGTATFIIMGDVCTRNCQYCNIKTGQPAKLDPEEPQNIALAIQKLKLKYAVITSVTRDDLPDYGADHFFQTILDIKKLNPETKIEILTPDFQGNLTSLEKVLSPNPFVFNHNIEVVKNLFHKIRPEGNYDLSLKLLKAAKTINPEQKTKSGFMVGLGETLNQIIQTLYDLKKADVDILTIGQYLQPQNSCAEVKKQYTPQDFSDLKVMAQKIGINRVFAGPLVRSSYHAGDLH